MVCRHIRNRAIYLCLNKVDTHTIHQRIACFFSLFSDIKHMAVFLILRRWGIYNEYFHFIYFNIDIVFDIAPINIQTV